MPSLLRVDGPVPLATPSPHYSFRVRPVGSSQWQTPFAFLTRCEGANSANTRYFSHLADWSNTYINFEMSRSEPVEVEIARVNGAPIMTAAAHPSRKAKGVQVLANGKVRLVISRPSQITVDIDGQMDQQDTGLGYSGPPIHTLTIFANPILEDRPDPTDPGVFAVAPGQLAPSTGPWHTLYFLPGVHDIGLAFPLHADRSYYIPGNAIVHGTMNNHGNWNDGHDIRIFGYGTLSGERYPHPEDAVPPAPPSDHSLYRPIQIVGPRDTRVEGITIADSPHHSLMLIGPRESGDPTLVRWVKIFTWRANGDGINPFGNVRIEDSFIRAQDDCVYVNGRGMRGLTFWNDANGSTFVLSSVGFVGDRKLVIEACDVLYARAFWHHWGGGRLFNMRGEGSGAGGGSIVFRKIRVEDPRPTLQHFMIAMQGVSPWSNPNTQRGPGELSGVLFQNIEIAAPSVLGQPDVLWGAPGAEIRGLVFDRVRIAGQPVLGLSHFQHNSHVSNCIFR
ncbi:MAG: endo-polygalacturonase [Planctomycetota bacterium]